MRAQERANSTKEAGLAVDEALAEFNAVVAASQPEIRAALGELKSIIGAEQVG
jgi:hypothetical protein